MSASSTAAALSPTKGQNRTSAIGVVMEGGATTGTRSMADGAYDMSTWGKPGNFAKVHARRGLYFATAASTELALKKAANASGRVMVKNFDAAGILPGRPDLGNITLQRTYSSEDLAYGAMDILEDHYRRKVAEDYELLGMPHQHLATFDHRAPR